MKALSDLLERGPILERGQARLLGEVLRDFWCVGTVYIFVGDGVHGERGLRGIAPKLLPRVAVGGSGRGNVACGSERGQRARKIPRGAAVDLPG